MQMCCSLVADEAFCSWCLSMEAQDGCQKLNESTERYVFVLIDEEAMQLLTYTFVQCSQNNGTWTEDQELAMPVSVMDCIA
jgi:hypothetical protein